ncbi:MAG: hypothetical protein IIZ78_18340 [Clostridiales bacterium]|nr:hypothetical protein [Clostridiales bacterium]
MEKRELIEKGRKIIVNMMTDDLMAGLEIKSNVGYVVNEAVFLTLENYDRIKEVNNADNVCERNVFLHNLNISIIEEAFENLTISGNISNKEINEWLLEEVDVTCCLWDIETLIVYTVAYVGFSENLDYVRREYEELTKELLKLDTNAKD